MIGRNKTLAGVAIVVVVLFFVVLLRLSICIAEEKIIREFVGHGTGTKRHFRISFPSTHEDINVMVGSRMLRNGYSSVPGKKEPEFAFRDGWQIVLDKAPDEGVPVIAHYHVKVWNPFLKLPEPNTGLCRKQSLW